MKKIFCLLIMGIISITSFCAWSQMALDGDNICYPDYPNIYTADLEFHKHCNLDDYKHDYGEYYKDVCIQILITHPMEITVNTKVGVSIDKDCYIYFVQGNCYKYTNSITGEVSDISDVQQDIGWGKNTCHINQLNPGIYYVYVQGATENTGYIDIDINGKATMDDGDNLQNAIPVVPNPNLSCGDRACSWPEFSYSHVACTYGFFEALGRPKSDFADIDSYLHYAVKSSSRDYSMMHYSDNLNHRINLTNNYGRPTNDVYYKLTITEEQGPLDVKITNCSELTNLSDTYIYLLDNQGHEIASNDDTDEEGDGVCAYSKIATLKKKLYPGVYYVVVEGYNENGIIETRITGTIPNEVPAASIVIDNYIKTITPMGSTHVWGSGLLSTQYFDGFGRLSQTVYKGITPLENDLVTDATEYNSIGKESRKWLPFNLKDKDNNGALVSDLSGKANEAYGSSGLNLYNEILYQDNSLNRIDKVYNPGGEYEELLHPKKFSYPYNVENDNSLKVSLFSIEDNKLKRTGLYSSNQLFVTQTTDEDEHVEYEFKNKDGQLVLKRAIAEAGNHDTHFVYDDLGRLRIVLSPMGSDELNTLTDTISLQKGNVLDRYAYLYNYDDQGRCIMKKLPGADSISMVYDRADRLILSQDGNQRMNNQWSFNKYDALGRTIQTGVINLTDKVAVLRTKYKDIAVIESFVSGSGYSNTADYGLNANFTILTQNYYDTYDFLNMSAYSAYKSNLTYSSTLQPGFDLKYTYLLNNKDYSAKGMLTGTDISMLDKSGAIITAMYYDDKGHVVQSLSRNILKGYDRYYYNYSWTGKVIRKEHMHNTSYYINIATDISRYKYDFADRLTDVWFKCKYNTDSIALCTMHYDELGRMDKKILHNGLYTMNYSYNLRGWLKSINSPLFSETLYYQDGPDGSPRYFNGNIGAVAWGAGNTLDKKYSYYYDGLNRMMSAIYSPGEKYDEMVDEYDKNGNINYMERVGCYGFSYPVGIQDGYFIDLIYNTYNGNQRQKTVDFADDQSLVLAKNDFKDDDNSLDVEYLYDKNGNLIADSNKGIAWIKYNMLNLPEKIQFTNGNKIEYAYDATGVKHKAKYTTALNPVQIPLGQYSIENSSSNVLKKDSMDYGDSYIYLNKKIDKLLTSEGYLLPSRYINDWSSWKSCYFLKDHLGNTRINLTSDYLSTHSSILAASGMIDYYPFGMEITPPTGTNSGTNPYLYNGKEIDRMHGFDMYDYGARWYDWANPGWGTVDPLAEKHPEASPYVYCVNNPISLIDPDGRDGTSVVDKENKTISISQTFYYDKNNSNFAKQGITQDLENGDQAQTSLLKQNGFESKTWTIKDEDGNEWSVSFNISFVPLDGEKAIDEALKNDQTANKLVYSKDLGLHGKWSAGIRTLYLGSIMRDGSTFIHEVGHSWGLPEANKMPYSLVYGISDNGLDSPVSCSIMSYNLKNREVKQADVEYGALKILQVANSTNERIVKIHVSGYSGFNNCSTIR